MRTTDYVNKAEAITGIRGRYIGGEKVRLGTNDVIMVGNVIALRVISFDGGRMHTITYFRHPKEDIIFNEWDIICEDDTNENWKKGEVI